MSRRPPPAWTFNYWEFYVILSSIVYVMFVDRMHYAFSVFKCMVVEPDRTRDCLKWNHKNWTARERKERDRLGQLQINIIKRKKKRMDNGHVACIQLEWNQYNRYDCFAVVCGSSECKTINSWKIYWHFMYSTWHHTECRQRPQNTRGTGNGHAWDVCRLTASRWREKSAVSANVQSPILWALGWACMEFTAHKKISEKIIFAHFENRLRKQFSHKSD